MPNGWGIGMAGGATIRGNGAARRNVISGNANDGINLNGSGVDNHTIIGNYIGTNAAGSGPLPNNNGVNITGGASGNSVGGSLATDANLIAYNNYSGVSVHGASLGNAIQGNWLHSNCSSGLVGIDLGGDGQTANDGTKSASLPNFGMDYPTFTAATLAADTLTVAGYVGSAPGQALFANARVELFESLPDGSDHGQGVSYLGFLTADGSGNLSGGIDVAGKGIVIGDRITATATDTNGNSSEYALDIVVAAAPTYAITGTIFEDADFAGTASPYDSGIDDLGLVAVDVELYSGADVYLASTATAGDGTYGFTGLADGDYKVRVRSATIGDADTPPAGTLSFTVPGTWPYPLAEMTWGHGSAMYGGQDAAADDTDTADDAGPGDTWVALTLAGADATGVDFGFAYNLIVNAADDALADTARSDQGSLRQFIKNANAIGGAGTTTANVSQFRMQVAADQSMDGDSWWRIQPSASLPRLADNGTTLDATSQEANSGTDSNRSGPEIELDGSLTPPGSWGMSISGGFCKLRGFAINGFIGNGIELFSNGGNAVLGNYVGTDARGATDLGNLGDGLIVQCADNTIGGTGAGEGNQILAAFGETCIDVSGAAADGNAIQGLSISREIILAHSGEIVAYNHPKGGAVFIFSLTISNRISVPPALDHDRRVPH